MSSMNASLNSLAQQLAAMRTSVNLVIGLMGEGLDSGAIQSQIDVATQSAITDILEQVGALDATALQKSISVLSHVLSLKNIYGAERFMFELFGGAGSTFSTADIFEATVTAPVVAGDDSIAGGGAARPDLPIAH